MNCWNRYAFDLFINQKRNFLNKFKPKFHRLDHLSNVRQTSRNDLVVPIATLISRFGRFYCALRFSSSCCQEACFIYWWCHLVHDQEQIGNENRRGHWRWLCGHVRNATRWPFVREIIQQTRLYAQSFRSITNSIHTHFILSFDLLARILSIAWHKDEEIIATGGIDNIRVWDANSGQILQRISLGRLDKNKETLVWCLTITS